MSHWKIILSILLIVVGVLGWLFQKSTIVENDGTRIGDKRQEIYTYREDEDSVEALLKREENKFIEEQKNKNIVHLSTKIYRGGKEHKKKNIVHLSTQKYRGRCDGRKYCSQMKSCDEAKYFLAHCPNTKMDGDRDGIPCEGQWCGH